MDPVIVSGAARSGTSMTTGCIHRCGLQIGSDCGPTPWNRKGQYENRELIQTAQKAYLSSIGMDPAAQHPLPAYEDLAPDPTRRERVLEVVHRQGVDTDSLWGFKDAKALVDWPIWDEAFPDAVWVLTRRDIEANARSCMNTRFMRAHRNIEGWREWAQYHRQRAEDLKAHAPDRVYIVDTEDLKSGRFDEIRGAVEAIGLQWAPDRIREFIDPALWHHGG